MGRHTAVPLGSPACINPRPWFGQSLFCGSFWSRIAQSNPGIVSCRPWRPVDSVDCVRDHQHTDSSKKCRFHARNPLRNLSVESSYYTSKHRLFNLSHAGFFCPEALDFIFGAPEASDKQRQLSLSCVHTACVLTPEKLDKARLPPTLTKYSNSGTGECTDRGTCGAKHSSSCKRGQWPGWQRQGMIPMTPPLAQFVLGSSLWLITARAHQICRFLSCVKPANSLRFSPPVEGCCRKGPTSAFREGPKLWRGSGRASSG